MAFVHSTIAMLLFQLSLLLCIHSIAVYGNITTSPAEAPHPPHGHHHHHHHTHAPSHSPVYPPIKPPHVKPPTHLPVKPPVHPPVKLPVYTPVNQPAHPPVNPPAHSHVKQPVHPPVVHPIKPVHPPVAYPVKPPANPPAVHPVKPPVHPPVPYPGEHPVHTPVAYPVKPPVHSPVQSPRYPPQRKLVGIRGVVLCKACKYRGVDTLTDSIPLSGAVVQLKCKNTKYPLVEKKTTDKNGFFIFMPKMLTTYGVHKCNVTLVSSPLKNCSHPTNLHGGVGGAAPFTTGIPPVNYVQPPLVVYTLQPFAFEAPKKFPCRRY